MQQSQAGEARTIKEEAIRESPVQEAVDPRVAADLEWKKVLAAMPPLTLQADGKGPVLTVRLGRRT